MKSVTSSVPTLMATVIALILCATLQNVVSANEEWNYGDKGPNYWKETFSSCSGERQSPINIVTADAIQGDWGLPDIITAPKVNGILKNNGHTAVFTPDPEAAETAATVNSGDLPRTYKLLQFHFHWGADSSKGSEHQLNDKQFAGELHFVMLNEDYHNASEALHAKSGEGLAVLGFFLEATAEEDNLEFKKITDALSDVIEPDTEAEVNDVNLRKLMTDEKYPYYRYMGSLTTPTCNEEVIWTVFGNPISLSPAQFEKFRALKVHGDEPMVDNFRPTQDLGNRDITVVESGSTRPSCVLAKAIAIPILLVTIMSTSYV